MGVLAWESVCETLGVDVFVYVCVSVCVTGFTSECCKRVNLIDFLVKSLLIKGGIMVSLAY